MFTYSAQHICKIWWNMAFFFYKSTIHYNLAFSDALFGLHYLIFKNILLGGIPFLLNSKTKSYLLIIFTWNENFKSYEKNILMKFPLMKIFNENTLNKCCHGNSFSLSINRYKSKSSVIGLFVQYGDNKYIPTFALKTC